MIRRAKLGNRGRTEFWRVGDAEDVLEQSYDWFSQSLFVRCPPGQQTVVVGGGPWHRGHDPSEDHLALAFYRNGREVRRYSTSDLAGRERSEPGAISSYKNISASVFH